MRTKWMQMALIVLASLVYVATVSAAGKAPATAAKKILLTPDQIQWKDAPPELPSAKMAVVDGDPDTKGFFVMRVKLPAGGKIPPHVHDNVERVTVLSGKLYLAMGDKAQNPTVLPAGSYFSLPPRTVHNAWVEEETVLQIASTGRWTMRLQKEKKATTE